MDETTNLDAGIIASEELNETATDGIMSEELDTNEELETNVESEEDIDKEASKKKKNTEHVKKILAEKNALATRVAELEKKDAIKDLKIKYGEFDETKLLELKDQHPTLSYEQAFMLNKELNPATVKETPKDFGSLNGRESTSFEKKTITMKELTSKDTLDYQKAREDIRTGKLVLVDGKL